EIHALLSTKRGADLALSLERLQAQSGVSVTRVGLSATCGPLSVTARYLVGSQRECAVARVDDDAPMHVATEWVETASKAGAVVKRIGSEIARQRTTLILVNARRQAEKWAWTLKHRLPQWAEQIGVHHSSIAAPRRRDTEQRLKCGRLRVVVCSSSL